MSRLHAIMAGDRWIPWIFVAMFAVVLIANGTMIYFAFDSWTGLTARSAYKQGRGFNRQLSERKAQSRLGWSASAGLRRTGARRGRLRFVLTGRDGAPLNGAFVQANLVRPVEAGRDFTIVLKGIGRGAYVADVAFPLRGQWEARFTATRKSRTFRASRRLMVE